MHVLRQINLLEISLRPLREQSLLPCGKDVTLLHRESRQSLVHVVKPGSSSLLPGFVVSGLKKAVFGQFLIRFFELPQAPLNQACKKSLYICVVD